MQWSGKKKPVTITTSDGAQNFGGERVPSEANVVARRRSTTILGLGLVDAVADATWLAIARPEASADAASAGRPNIVLNLATREAAVGKFGWKAQVPTLVRLAVCIA
ncbi:MAG: hypothetical protein DMG04_24585 [Acidobacteria bacterium]|nr:MAG: hypothetical protein DMG04_24585 [Acidobacteriota bacterium]PYQ87577.1 MAG: hypothetical protein DMG03_05220 [Acidobacteriota bacterium]PYQ88235.1 MAG: hypothetical protein DMG02_19100 [Acidobacteriota bacterium]PYR04961.1 MAG: hypothetical protein DMF99_30300 [Acidobacteriota bacterium]